MLQRRNSHCISPTVNSFVAELLSVLSELTDNVMILISGLTGQLCSRLQLSQCSGWIVGCLDNVGHALQVLSLIQRSDENIRRRRQATDNAQPLGSLTNKPHPPFGGLGSFRRNRWRAVIRPPISRELHTVDRVVTRRDLKEAEAACAAICPLPAVGIAGRHARLVWIVFARQRGKRFGDIRARRKKSRGVGTNPACRIWPQPSRLLMAQPGLMMRWHRKCP